MVIVATALRDPSSLHCLGDKMARTVAVFSALDGCGDGSIRGPENFVLLGQGIAEIGGHSFARSRKVLPIKELRLSPADRGANDQSAHKRPYIFASRNLPFLLEIKRQIMEDNCS